MTFETTADRVRGVVIHARALAVENPTALIYAHTSCGGESPGERAELARALRAYHSNGAARGAYLLPAPSPAMPAAE